jgi:hypothetical protein
MGDVHLIEERELHEAVWHTWISICNVALGSVGPKFEPSKDMATPPSAGPFGGFKAVEVGASNENSASVVPTCEPILTPPATSTPTPGGIMQATLENDVHELDLQCAGKALCTLTVAVGSKANKLSPNSEMNDPPELGEFA